MQTAGNSLSALFLIAQIFYFFCGLCLLSHFKIMFRKCHEAWKKLFLMLEVIEGDTVLWVLKVKF